MSTLTIDRYLAALPAGIDSYPDYTQKGSITRSYLASPEVASSLHALPQRVRELAASPPTVAQWVPEVVANVVFLSMTERLGIEGFEDFVYRENKALLEGPLYAILFKLVSPERVLRSATSRWAQFHRGIELEAPRISRGQAEVDMRCPPALLPPILARVYTMAFRAALEAAGGNAVTVELVAERPDGYTFGARWR